LSYRLIINSEQLENSQISLSADQLHYLKRVLRLQDGETFVALDGNGISLLVALEQKTGRVLEHLEQNNELSRKIHLMVALPKGSGFEDIIRSCTELGVASFIPISSERTLLDPSQAKLERWRKISQEATEQCERQIVPQIFPAVKLTNALANLDLTRITPYLLVTRQSDIPHLAAVNIPQEREILLAIGPEGGWSEREIESFIAAGFVLVSLGNRILRTVSAPIVAVSMLNAIFRE